MNDNQNNKETAFNWLLGVFTKWGVGETVAKLIAGALIGAMVAVGLLSCKTITTEQMHTAHEIYHQLTNDPCIFTVENWKK